MNSCAQILYDKIDIIAGDQPHWRVGMGDQRGGRGSGGRGRRMHYHR